MAYEDKLFPVVNKALESKAGGEYIDPYITYQEDIPFTHNQGYVPDLISRVSNYGVENYFPELSETDHFAFNDFIAEHPELQGRSDVYNIIGGMDVAKRIQPGEKEIGYDWSGPGSLSALAGLYSIKDSILEPAQDWKEGFADWYRNIKGIGIQRDWNPLGLLYDSDEADYYREYYEKLQKDFKRMEKGKWENLRSGILIEDDYGNLKATEQQAQAADAADLANIKKTQKHTGAPLSDYRMSRPASERQYTGHGKSGMGRDRSELMATGGIVDVPLPGRSRYI